MRASKNRKTACKRLARLFGSVSIEREGRGYLIHVEGSDLPPAKKSTKETLAFLADLARATGMDQAAVQRKVRWVGSIPSRGLAAWQEYALTWLQGTG